MVRLVRFLKVSVMLCWRMAVLALALFTVQPSWGGYPLLVFGVPVIVAGILVFGLRRTLLTFPVIRILRGTTPVPDEEELRRREALAREKARERTAAHERSNPAPSALFDQRAQSDPRDMSGLDEHQLAEIRATFGVVLAEWVRALSEERVPSLRTREAEAGSRGNHLMLRDARASHERGLYQDAANAARRQVMSTYRIAHEGRFDFEDEVIAAHRIEESRRRREGSRTADEMQSAAERRRVYEEHQEFVRRRTARSTVAQRRLLDALIAAALDRSEEFTRQMISDHFPEAVDTGEELTTTTFRKALARNTAEASFEQVSMLLSQYELERMDMASDSYLLLLDVYRLVPMTPADAHTMAIEHLADRHRLADGGEVEKILDRIRY